MTYIPKNDRTKTSEPLAAGTYLVGDPCYAFSNDLDENWQNWLEDAWKDADPNQIRILDGRVKGMRVAASGTAYGDGEYYDQNGFSYMVDAGMLGAVHIKFLRNLYPEHDGKTNDELEAALGMRVVEFARPFHVEYDDGIIQIGHIMIQTGDEDDEDEDEEGYWSIED